MSATTQADAAKTAGLAVDDGRVDPADEQLVRELAERARAEGVSLTGPGGLLGRLTKVVLESVWGAKTWIDAVELQVHGSSMPA